MTKKQKILMIVFALAVIGMAVAQWLVLPEQVVLQVDLQGGAGTVAPKIAAVALPLVIGLAGVYRLRTEVDSKAVLLAAIGVVIPVVTMLMNR